MRVRRYSAVVAVKTVTTSGGAVQRIESGVAIQGSGGDQQKTVN